MKSQKQQVLEWLQSGKSITPREAINMWHCYRVGDVVWKLQQEGQPIINENPRGPGIPGKYRLVTPEVYRKAEHPVKELTDPLCAKLELYEERKRGYPEEHNQISKINTQIERLKHGK